MPLSESMLQRLEEVSSRYRDLLLKQGDPDVVANPAKLAELGRKVAELEPVVQELEKYKRLSAELNEVKGLLEDDDPEMRQLASSEAARLERELETVERKLKLLLLPEDPNDKRNVILEIRAGTGGEEAALFAAELLRMYQRYAESKGWKVSLLEAHQTGLGGIKEAVAMIEGNKVYSRLKYESGVHRVQRVPVTESSGRIHTSAATVAVLPEAEEVEVEIDEKDLRIDRFCASGPGGQHVNTTYSAVRITHLPTGIVVSCQDEKSQIQNKAKALRVLKARLKKLKEEEQARERAAERRAQVGTGDRSEKIRTYNFPQGRVTDHRIGLTIYRLQDVLDGNLDLILEPVITHFEAERLKKELGE